MHLFLKKIYRKNPFPKIYRINQCEVLINKTGDDIYIYREGFRNGTRIYNNSSTKVDCSYNYTYKSDSNSSGSGTSCYNANSGCSRSVTVN